MCIALLQPHPPTPIVCAPPRYAPTHGCARRDPLIEMHWRFGVMAAPVRSCQATSWDRSTRVYSGLRHVSSITPSMKSLPAPLDLEEEEWSRDACARFRGVSERTSPATAISHSAPAMFGDGGWRIGLCARIPNEPMYQLADTLGVRNQYCPSSA